MKVAIFSESPADEAAVRIIVDTILGHPTEPIPLAGIVSRGVGSLRKNLPAVYKQLYFNPEVQGLIVVVDSDDSLVHEQSHEVAGASMPNCRYCAFQAIIAETKKHCRPMPGRVPLKTAVGLAVPAIEAWFRAGKDIHVTEQAWARGPVGRTFDRASLKMDLYGMDRAPLAHMTAAMIREATRLAADIALLERHFPGGFGAMLRELRTW